ANHDNLAHGQSSLYGCQNPAFNSECTGRLRFSPLHDDCAGMTKATAHLHIDAHMSDYFFSTILI
ncbi:MAG: hypothetical protein JWP89_4291, partial [Schlesneria sp.]|nr:hypothetical protein [Schlesneria sp.]